jgi:hypothetical protein
MAAAFRSSRPHCRADNRRPAAPEAAHTSGSRGQISWRSRIGSGGSWKVEGWVSRWPCGNVGAQRPARQRSPGGRSPMRLWIGCTTAPAVAWPCGSERRPRPPRVNPAAPGVASDVTGDPSQNVGVGVARLPYRRPLAEGYSGQSQARPHEDGRDLDRRKQRLQAGGDRSYGRRGHDALPSRGRDFS